MIKENLKLKMIDFYKGNIADINHFLKVCAYAEIIGKLEHLTSEEQEILALTAIVHDISCPLCREKYGNTNGKHQEAESEALLRPFLLEYHLPEPVENRIIYLVSHHHTYTGVHGMDYQVLLEADYLVNAEESSYSIENIQRTRNQIFKTKTGIYILDSVFGESLENVNNQFS